MKLKSFFYFLVITPALSAQVETSDLEIAKPIQNQEAELLSFEGSQTLTLEKSYLGSWFQNIPDKDHPLVNRYEQLYRTTQVNYIINSLERAKSYKDLIFQVLDELNAPRELFFLPIIESAFASTATSRVGAAGMWQFMPRSAVPYDMNINLWLDERRDFLKSTRGAIKKLLDEYELFKDWHLTLAAYNCGVGRIQRILNTYGPIDFWEMADRRLLPRETIHYVPKFLAVLRVASQAGRMNFPISWESESQYAIIHIPFQADLNQLARLAGVDYQRLRSFNRELIYGITPDGGHDLKVPIEWEENIRSALAINPELSKLRFYIHRVRSGDTLSALARHFGVPVAMIQRYNNNVRPHQLRINQQLIIPVLHQNRLVPPPIVSPPSAQAPRVQVVSGSNTASYVVQQGDTLWSLARSWNTTVEQLRTINNLSPTDSLRIGQVLKRP